MLRHLREYPILTEIQSTDQSFNAGTSSHKAGWRKTIWYPRSRSVRHQSTRRAVTNSPLAAIQRRIVTRVKAKPSWMPRDAGSVLTRSSRSGSHGRHITLHRLNLQLLLLLSLLSLDPWLDLREVASRLIDARSTHVRQRQIRTDRWPTESSRSRRHCVAAVAEAGRTLLCLKRDLGMCLRTHKQNEQSSTYG